MIASAKQVRSRKSAPVWHTTFVTMLPAIVRHARISFRHLGAEAREEAIQAVLCNACSAIARLAELDKLDLAYATVLAHYGVAQVNHGRLTGGRLNCKDIASPYCQRLKGVTVERLDKYDVEEDSWQEIVIEDRHVGPDEVVATKLDFAAWLRCLSRRNRRIAQFLAVGHRTGEAARRFKVSAGRISQVRGELQRHWQDFIGGGGTQVSAAASA
jgi:hypothetical protein